MLKRGTQTDQLKNVIQVLQFGKKSGILTVTCQGDTVEEGKIAFIQGQITEVQFGQLRNQPALNALLKRRCRFVFAEVGTNTEPQILQTPITPIPASPAPHESPAPGLTARRASYLRQGARPITRPLSASRQSPDPGLATRRAPYQEHGTRPITHILPEHGKQESAPITTNTSKSPPLFSVMVPSRRLQDNESFQRITRAGLSRLHMHLFLLVDGERSALEMARLLHHSAAEVEKMLSDLEAISVIQQ